MSEIVASLNLKVAQQVLLKNGDRVVLASWGYGIASSIHGENHNVFRLDPNNNMVWQVQRDEQGKLNWEAMHAIAISRGQDGAREPFGDIVLIYADGTNNGNPSTGNPPEVAQWAPGCTVRLRSFSGSMYDLDIDSGIARNVTPHRQRPW